MKNHILTLFFCLTSISVGAQIQVISDVSSKGIQEVVLFDYPNLETLVKYKKMELGVRLDDYINKRIDAFVKETAVSNKNFLLNPFLSWNIKITAEFKHIESGKKESVDAFYYRDFRELEEIEGWRSVKTPYNFRVRFSPSDVGDWTCNLVIRVEDNIIEDPKLFDFKVKDLGNPSYVSVHSNTKNFERNGEMFIPLGVNIPYPEHNSNTEYSYNPNKEDLNLSVWRNYLEDIKNYSNLDGENKLIRIFMAGSSTDIEFEKVGNYYDRLDYAWEMDKVIETCERNNTLIDFNLMLHTPIMKFADFFMFRWDFGKASKYDNFPVNGYSKLLNTETPSDMFTTELGMKYLKEKHRYIYSRWGYSTTIMMFELLSEPWHLNESGEFDEHIKYTNIKQPYDLPEGDFERQTISNYHWEMSDFIKNELNHKNHLIGAVGHMPYRPTDIFPSWAESSKKVDSSWFSPNIDVVCLSIYDVSPFKMIKTKGRSNQFEHHSSENSYNRYVSTLHEAYNKPVLFSEAGHNSATDQCAQLQPNIIDVDRFAFTGAAGMNIWSAFMHTEGSKYDQRDNWKPGLAIHNFINSDEVLDIFKSEEGNWIQGRERYKVYAANEESDDEYLKEIQFIMSADHEKAVGYIYNLTYNINTLSDTEIDTSINSAYCQLAEERYHTPLIVDDKNGKVSIQKLKRRSTYKVNYYRYSSGELIGTYLLKSNWFGKLKMKHPELIPTTSGTPIIWFTALPVEG